MKKQFLFFTLGCVSLNLQAQQWNSSSTTLPTGATVYTYKVPGDVTGSFDGKIGIGFPNPPTAPLGMLHVKTSNGANAAVFEGNVGIGQVGTFTVSGQNVVEAKLHLDGPITSDLMLRIGPGSTQGGSNWMDIGRPVVTNNLAYQIKIRSQGGGAQFNIVGHGVDKVNIVTSSDGINNASPLERFFVKGDGEVGIGQQSDFTKGFPAPYRLFVSGGILTEKLKLAIKTTYDWADYVFQPNYAMLPLESLEEYVKCNQHLPGVPSAQEVVDNGLDVAKMDAKLLEKIEEMSLYLIQLKKENMELKSRMDKYENNK